MVCALSVGNYVWWSRARDSAFRVDSLEAATDTTRRVLTESLTTGIAAWQRRAIQQGQIADSIDRQLDLERRARLIAEATVDTLRARATGVVRVENDVRTAHFAGREEPYTYDADVALPAPPAEGSLDLQITLDSIRLETRLGCGDAVGGVRPAQVTVLGPSWATLSLSEVEQAREVCASPILTPPGFTLWSGDVPWWLVPLSFVAGIITF